MVSTYEQDIKGVAVMTEGRLMPRPLSILAAVMSITFVGQGSLPKDWLYMTFKVRRTAVKNTLLWLRMHNPKYYGDINIDKARLDNLPEDDVPVEIMANIWQSTDTGIVEQESAGYVPQDDDDPVYGVSIMLI